MNKISGVKYLANAKLNLNLHVLKKLQYYHEIDSIFLPCFTLFDEMEFQRINDNKANCYLSTFYQQQPIVIADNLILKIFNFCQQKFQLTDSLKIQVNKKIPLGAGLGGASSNAYFTLKAICQLFNISLSVELLNEITSKFGADIFFFHYNCLLRCKNNHFQVTKIKTNLVMKPFVFLNQVPCSTKEVFRNFDFKTKQPNQMEAVIEKITSNEADFIHLLTNDLQTTALKLYPQLVVIKQKLVQDNPGKKLLLSGSGSTFFYLEVN